MVIAHHLILTGYGHWLPNDPRGSMSQKVHTSELAKLAAGHFGRRRTQPSREELKAFYRKAKAVLVYPVIWFESAERQAIAEAFGEVIAAEKLTCYSCAVLSNHAHLLIRKHRLKGEQIVSMLKDSARGRLREKGLVPRDHPVFSADMFQAFKSDPQAVKACTTYIEGNFAKHNLPPLKYPFVTPYDNWPFHKK